MLVAMEAIPTSAERDPHPLVTTARRHPRAGSSEISRLAEPARLLRAGQLVFTPSERLSLQIAFRRRSDRR